MSLAFPDLSFQEIRYLEKRLLNTVRVKKLKCLGGQIRRLKQRPKGTHNKTPKGMHNGYADRYKPVAKKKGAF